MQGDREIGEVARIAEGLTAAQREAVLGAVEKNDGALRSTRWLCANASRVCGPLLAKGLIYLAVPMFSWRSNRRDTVLTPLGIQVRGYLANREGR